MNTLNWINGAEEEGFARLRGCGSLIIGGLRVLRMEVDVRVWGLGRGFCDG